MAALRNKLKLATVSRETQAEFPKSGQSRSESELRIKDEYNTQVSEDNEGKISNKLSQEFSRAESRILGALYLLGKNFLKPRDRDALRNRSGNFPEHGPRT